MWTSHQHYYISAAFINIFMKLFGYEVVEHVFLEGRRANNYINHLSY